MSDNLESKEIDLKIYQKHPILMGYLIGFVGYNHQFVIKLLFLSSGYGKDEYITDFLANGQLNLLYPFIGSFSYLIAIPTLKLLGEIFRIVHSYIVNTLFEKIGFTEVETYSAMQEELQFMKLAIDEMTLIHEEQIKNTENIFGYIDTKKLEAQFKLIHGGSETEWANLRQKFVENRNKFQAAKNL